MLFPFLNGNRMGEDSYQSETSIHPWILTTTKTSTFDAGQKSFGLRESEVKKKRGSRKAKRICKAPFVACLKFIYPNKII